MRRSTVCRIAENKMRALFHKWLLLFVVLAFGLTFGLSWYLHRKEAKKNALQLLSLNLTDASNRVRRAEANLRTITEMSAASAIAKTRAFALLLKEKPEILRDPAEMRLIRQKLDVDELHVSDKNGKLVASLAHTSYSDPEDHVGFNLASTEQSRAFMKCITDRNFELVQEPQYNGARRQLFQYAGVARLDAPGVVQIGYLPTRIKRAYQLADVKNIEAEVRIGINGKLFIREDAEHTPGYQKTFYTREGLCQSVMCGKYLLTAMLPWNEVYSKDRTVITTLFAGNLIVFVLIFIMISKLLQKVVIKEISAVTDSLDEFSKGNFDKTIEVKGSSEMHALAESINKTVSALKENAVPARVETDTEIITMLKNSLRPANIPENKNYKFTAEIFTATEVGRNLCDFFKVDNEHIAMFFADVTENGIPAGLYMMNAKNMLRKALLKNSPEKALRIVNEELYDSRKNMPLKAFIGILNLHSGVLLTFNAGHVDPVIKSRNGNVKFIKGPFIAPLGAFEDTGFTSLPLQLNAGDRLCFYSNDMIEVQNGTGEKYGTARLLDIFSSDWDEAHKVIDSIYHGVKEFAGANATDADIAIAILEYTPENA